MPSWWRRADGSTDVAEAGVGLRQASASRLTTAAAANRGADMISAVPATPDLLAKIEALPPAADEPDIPDSLSHAADPQFGLRNLIRPVRRVMLIGFALVGVDTLLQLLAPALVRTGIDQGVTGNDSGILFGASAVVFLLIVGDFFVSRISQLVTGRTGERLLYLLRVKTFAHLQRLGLDYYEREMGGRIITRMTTDVDALSNFLQTGLVTTLISVLTVVGVLIALLILDAGLSLILIALLPVIAAATWLFRRQVVPAYQLSRERVSLVNAQLQENVAGVRVTQAFGREGRNAEQFLDSASAYRESRLRAQTYIAIYFPFIQFLSDLAGAVVLGIGAMRLRDGTLSAGTLIAFFLYLERVLRPDPEPVAGLRRLPAGQRRVVAAARPAAHPDDDTRARPTGAGRPPA